MVGSPRRWSSPMSFVRSPVWSKRFRRAVTILKNLFGLVTSQLNSKSQHNVPEPVKALQDNIPQPVDNCVHNRDFMVNTFQRQQELN